MSKSEIRTSIREPGPYRTRTAQKAIGCTVVQTYRFTADCLVLSDDPLGRSPDTLTIYANGIPVGTLLHKPGDYLSGCWHARIASKLTNRAALVCAANGIRLPHSRWWQHIGPCSTPKDAITEFARYYLEGLHDCPEVFNITDNLPTPSQLSAEFSKRIRDTLSAEELQQVISRNAAETNPAICHTHDFCDANEVMLDASRTWSDPLSSSTDQLMSDAWDTCWSAAWTAAKRANFNYKGTQ